MTLVETTYREKHGEREVLQNYQLDKRVKGSERRPFIFISRLNIVQRDSYQADEIVMEIEEWKQKVANYYVKSYSRVLLGVGDINSILKKLYILYEFSLCCSSLIIVNS